MALTYITACTKICLDCVFLCHVFYWSCSWRKALIALNQLQKVVFFFFPTVRRPVAKLSMPLTRRCRERPQLWEISLWKLYVLHVNIEVCISFCLRNWFANNLIACISRLTWMYYLYCFGTLSNSSSSSSLIIPRVNNNPSESQGSNSFMQMLGKAFLLLLFILQCWY